VLDSLGRATKAVLLFVAVNALLFGPIALYIWVFNPDPDRECVDEDRFGQCLRYEDP
jgi:hypothetical protein